MQVRIATFTSALALLLGLGVAAAAQGSILLQGGAGQPITFSGQGDYPNGNPVPAVGVTLGTCDSSGVCTLSGTATGSGSAAITSSGDFTLTSSPNSIYLTPLGYYGCCGSLASSSAPVNFVLTGSTNGQTGTLLAGTLDLIDFTQASGSNLGSFNDFGPFNPNGPVSFEVDLCQRGLLDSVFPVGGALQLNVQFPTSESINALLGTEQTLSASLTVSTLAPTPEPSSLALMGVGLLVLGAGVRRRGRNPVTT